MYFVCIGMVFYLSSSSRIIQKAMFRFPVSELRLRCWKKMALNPSSSGMQKCQQAGTSCPEFDVREMWSDFHDQKKVKSAIKEEPNTARNNKKKLLLGKKSQCTNTVSVQIASRILFVHVLKYFTVLNRLSYAIEKRWKMFF